ncbi:erythromycin esterase family protein [Hymenobacter chitinivorans]|uniref:Erythromycin esterase-like protein n=1 Tax=Hymenobacter chitinivorans DSM 11115 TaxID=1121954 RepID=A0A2M9BLH7_9BACT|nr:erythromycin esterase family protein [Hymenobacter chitinivorans]PJJ58781.1 erythromycin esterase-like protein [Hymenobacter chitinivorans DSM 11115]
MKKIRYAWLLSLWWCLAACSDKDEVGPGNLLSLPDTGISRLETTQDLDPILQQMGPARYALLGEASHGTAEFYTWRAALSKRLIQEKGFTMIAVEGDWPAIYELNRYVRGQSSAGSAVQSLQSLHRWPTWLWANQEVANLLEWVRTYNKTQPAARQVGFYGLDLYSMVQSLEQVRTDFSAADQATHEAVINALSCLEPYRSNEEAYGTATLRGVSCATEINAVLTAVRARRQALPATDEAGFSAEQNALLAVNAERYYRTAVQESAGSWNIRDQHMMETINRLMDFHGPAAKIIVWAHNTHVGDARYTDMAARGEVNVGQLTRQQHGAEGVFVVGSGTYQGTVVAAPFWGGATTIMPVPAAPQSSWEGALHAKEPRTKLVMLQGWRQDPALTERRGHRAIGVVYDPGQESGNYVPSDLPNRYDAFLFLDQTQALHPLPATGGRPSPEGAERVAQQHAAANF